MHYSKGCGGPKSGTKKRERRRAKPGQKSGRAARNTSRKKDRGAGRRKSKLNPLRSNGYKK